jgi:tetratricopeptide (TPR) repeat protein
MRASESFVPLLSPEAKRVIHELRTAPAGITVLLGSAVSQFEPSGVPTGAAFTNAIAGYLSKGAVSAPHILGDLLWATAFEHVMERCPAPEIVRRELSHSLRNTPPNDVHRAFARLTDSGVVRHLVTTNYDTGLEGAFADCCPTFPLIIVRRKAETRRLRGTEPNVLFKIHGCAQPKFAKAMAFRLRDEAELPQWKRSLLQHLVSGRPLLVAGYSGMDFEICPELAQMGASRIVWLTYDSLTDNAAAVVDSTNAVVLKGDVKTLAQEFGLPCSADRSTAPASVVDRIFASLDARQIDLWRARIYGEIGCGADAAAAAQRLQDIASSEAEYSEALAEHARAIFHVGQYLDAAAEYTRAADFFRRSGDSRALRGALHGLAESSRCAGQFRKARAAVRAVEALARTAPSPRERAEAEVNAAVLRVTLRRHLYQIANVLPGVPFAKAIRMSALRDLRLVAARAAVDGEWLFLAQVRLWAQRYDVEWEDVYTGRMRILDAGKSYGQLGYVTAKIMAFRDQLAKGEIPPDASTTAQRYFRTLLGIRDYPEVWKLVRIVRRKIGAGAVTSKMSKAARLAKRRCQYTPLMRIMQLFVG